MSLKPAILSRDSWAGIGSATPPVTAATPCYCQIQDGTWYSRLTWRGIFEDWDDGDDDILAIYIYNKWEDDDGEDGEVD